MKIFICYRRSDSDMPAGRLSADLARKFGKNHIFQDVDRTIPGGANFQRQLTEILSGCDAVLAVIGPTWLSCQEPNGSRRIDNPADWIRKELAIALKHKIPLIPVLVGGASALDEKDLPKRLKPLSSMNAITLSVNYWEKGINEIVEDLKRSLPFKETIATIGRILQNLLKGILAEKLGSHPFMDSRLEKYWPTTNQQLAQRSPFSADIFRDEKSWTPQALDEFISELMTDRSRNAYVVMSGVGQGKTTFILHLALQIQKRNDLALPIFAECGDPRWGNVTNREQLISAVSALIWEAAGDLQKSIDLQDIEAVLTFKRAYPILLFDRLDGHPKPDQFVATLLPLVSDRPYLIAGRERSLLALSTIVDPVFMRLKGFDTNTLRTFFTTDPIQLSERIRVSLDVLRIPLIATILKKLISSTGVPRRLRSRADLYSQFVAQITEYHDSNIPRNSRDLENAIVGKLLLQSVAFAALSNRPHQVIRLERAAFLSINSKYSLNEPIAELVAWHGFVEYGTQYLWFKHQSFQEFFAALYIDGQETDHGTLTPANLVLAECWDSKWTEVLRFLVGLNPQRWIPRLLDRDEPKFHFHLWLLTSLLVDVDVEDLATTAALEKRLAPLLSDPPYNLMAAVAVGELRFDAGIQLLSLDAEAFGLIKAIGSTNHAPRERQYYVELATEWLSRQEATSPSFGKLLRAISANELLDGGKLHDSLLAIFKMHPDLTDGRSTGAEDFLHILTASPKNMTAAAIGFILSLDVAWHSTDTVYRIALEADLACIPFHLFEINTTSKEDRRRYTALAVSMIYAIRNHDIDHVHRIMNRLSDDALRYVIDVTRYFEKRTETLPESFIHQLLTVIADISCRQTMLPHLRVEALFRLLAYPQSKKPTIEALFNWLGGSRKVNKQVAAWALTGAWGEVPSDNDVMPSLQWQLLLIRKISNKDLDRDIITTLSRLGNALQIATLPALLKALNRVRIELKPDVLSILIRHNGISSTDVSFLISKYFSIWPFSSIDEQNASARWFLQHPETVAKAVLTSEAEISQVKSAEQLGIVINFAVSGGIDIPDAIRQTAVLILADIEKPDRAIALTRIIAKLRYEGPAYEVPWLAIAIRKVLWSLTDHALRIAALEGIAAVVPGEEIDTSLYGAVEFYIESQEIDALKDCIAIFCSLVRRQSLMRRRIVEVLVKMYSDSRTFELISVALENSSDVRELVLAEKPKDVTTMALRCLLQASPDELNRAARLCAVCSSILNEAEISALLEYSLLKGFEETRATFVVLGGISADQITDKHVSILLKGLRHKIALRLRAYDVGLPTSSFVRDLLADWREIGWTYPNYELLKIFWKRGWIRVGSKAQLLP